MSLRHSAPATQVLKFHDLAHAAHWHAPGHAHQFTKLEGDEGAEGPPDLQQFFDMVDANSSGTIDADGLCPTHEPSLTFSETLLLLWSARGRPQYAM